MSKVEKLALVVLLALGLVNYAFWLALWWWQAP